MVSKAIINNGGLWTVVSGTTIAVVFAFNTFATAGEVEDLRLNIAYGQYYDRLDDYEESLAEGRVHLAEEYKRQMERLKAQICEHDPEWERC